ncbi:hypothetical protein [Streptomyces sp. NPDC051561]|uniref:hypothetical protein n=1 Tax=Streptomyces sp. NPDC051561 TaxID=3365658 RepID=UPI0037AF11B8
MLLGIGDVVRIRNCKTLGTVAGVAAHNTGSLVVLTIGPGLSRPVVPSELELVARGMKPQSTARSVWTLIFLALALVVAGVLGGTVHDLGGGLALTVFVALSSVSAIFGGLVNTFHRPRRVRV